MTEIDMSYSGKGLNDGLKNTQKDVESCRLSCKSKNANYFILRGNKWCYCNDSRSGRKVVKGVISGETKCAGIVKFSSISKIRYINYL